MHIGTTIKLTTNKDIIDAIDQMLSYGGNAIQINVSPLNNSTNGDSIDPDVKEIVTNSGIYFVVHGKYTYNFCKPKLYWQITSLTNELRKANQIGSNVGVVIHQGKNVNKIPIEEAIDNYVDNIINVIELTRDIPNMILLENSCQQGTEIGYQLDQLGLIYHKIAKKYPKRVGICLDTCHIFVSGQLNFGSDRLVDNFMLDFDKIIGLKNLKVIHFNDSSAKFNQHNDHHCDISKGYIGQHLQRMVGWAKQYNIPLILETNGKMMSKKEQIDMVNEWATQTYNLPSDKKKIILKKKTNPSK